MGKIFNNHTELNNGFFLNGMTPLDDRLVWSSLEDLYIDSNNKEQCGLYAVAYEGMQVEIVNGVDVPRLFVLKDVYPYSPDNKPGEYAVNVTEENFRDYWYEISALHIKSEDKTINVEMTETLNGKVVDLGVNIDADSIQSIDGVLTSYKYKLIKLQSPNANMLASYRLQHIVPGQNAYTNVPGCADIDVPKDYILKEVHVCKAKTENGKLVEVVVQGECTDQQWIDAEGEVYLHFFWDTADALENPSTSESWIKVSEMIDLDLDALENAVAELRKDHDALEIELKNADASLNTRITNEVSTLNKTITNKETALNNKISALDTKLSGEIDDEVAARKALDSSLTSAIGTLNTNLSKETTDRKSADTTLTNSVNAINASIGNTGSKTIATQLSEIVSSVEDLTEQEAEDVSTLTANINSVNTTLTKKIGDETTARKAEDSSLATAIATLKTNLSTETTERKNADSTLTTSVNAINTKIGEIGDDSIATQLSDIRTSIDNLSDTETNDVSTLTANINSVNTKLTKSINDEKAAREAADTSISNALKKINDALGGEGDIATSLGDINDTLDLLDGEISELETKQANDVSTLTNSINTLKTNVNSSISTLESSLKKSITDLSTNVDNEIARVEKSVTDLTTSVNTKVDDINSTIDTLDTQHSTDVSTLRAADTKLTTDLASLNTTVTDNKTATDATLAEHSTKMNALDASIESTYNKLLEDELVWAQALTELRAYHK